MRCCSTASAAGRCPTTTSRRSVIRTLDARELADDRLRLLPGGDAAHAALLAEQGRGRARLRARRPLRARPGDDPRDARELARRPAPARRPGLRRRGLAGCPREDPLGARHDRAPPRGDRDLRGVHLALPRVLGRPDDPLAVLHGLQLDGLGRPRHARRLEHLAVLGRGDEPARLVAGPRRRRLHELLGLPAPRQPLPARAGRERALAAHPEADDATGAAARVRRARRPDRARARAGATAATSTAPG